MRKVAQLGKQDRAALAGLTAEATEAVVETDDAASAWGERWPFTFSTLFVCSWVPFSLCCVLARACLQD